MFFPVILIVYSHINDDDNGNNNKKNTSKQGAFPIQWNAMGCTASSLEKQSLRLFDVDVFDSDFLIMETYVFIHGGMTYC